MTTPPDNAKLSPWPVRLLVYAVLLAVALLAIYIIDGHVMARHSRLVPSAATAPAGHARDAATAPAP